MGRYICLDAVCLITLIGCNLLSTFAMASGGKGLKGNLTNFVASAEDSTLDDVHQEMTPTPSKLKPEKDMFGDKTSDEISPDAFRLDRQNPTMLETPENMTFFENLLFWDTLVCNTAGLCGARDFVSHPIVCSPLQCGDCSCNDCDKNKECCVDTVKQTSTSLEYKEAYLSCQSASPKLSDNNTREGNSYYFINKCPEFYKNQTIREMCESTSDVRTLPEMLLKLPVFSNVTQMNYQNAYCAWCHGYHEDLLSWDPLIRCSSFVDVAEIKTESDIFDLVLKSKGCHMDPSPPIEGDHYACGSPYTGINECNVTGQWTRYDENLQKGCHAYKHVVRSSSIRYHNVFCAMCNGLTYDSILKLFRNGFQCPRWPLAETESLPSFSMLFNLHQDSPSTISSRRNGLRECREDQVYDPYSASCRALVCSKGRIYRNHSCVHVQKTAKYIGYKLHYVLRPVPSPYHLSARFVDLWSTYLEEFLFKNEILQPLSLTYEYAEMTFCYERFKTAWLAPATLVHSLHVEYRAVVGTNLSPDEVGRVFLNLSKASWEYGDTAWNAQEGIFRGQRRDQEIYCNVTFGETIKTSESESEEKTIYNGYMLGSRPYIRVSTVSGCNPIELAETEYTVDVSSGNIQLARSNETLTKAEYTMNNGTVQICVNYSGWYEAEAMDARMSQSKVQSHTDEVEKWLTLISLVLSLSGLAMTFLMDLLTKSRQTLPGKITLVLVSTLFTAQLLFLLSGYASGKLWPCRLLGLAVHYFWLAVFFWKNMAAYHMYVVFVKPFQHTTDNQIHSLLKYSLYGYGAPGVTVGSYTLIRSLLSGSGEIGYGDKSCFLSRPIDIGLAFVLPVGIVLVTNVFFFGRAVQEIKKMSDMEKNMNRLNSHHTMLYVKMSLVLGFSWVVGFVANIVNTTYLWYVFIALNGGAGVLIFLSQLCNRQAVRCLSSVPTTVETANTLQTSDTPDKTASSTPSPKHD